MANTIQIKRGSGTPTSAQLASYELGYATTDNILYINKAGTIIPLATNLKNFDLRGSNLILGTSSSSSNDSSDIEWRYGSGQEKARIWTGNDYTVKTALYFREYKSDGTSLYDGYLVLGDGTGASGTWGISISGNATTATKATQDGDGNTISSTYLKLSGGTLTGNLTLSKSTTIAANNPARLQFSVTQTDNNVTSSGYILAYDDHDASGYGTNMVIYGAGNMFIGGGESPYNLYSNVFTNSTTEHLFLTADGAIYAYSNANSYGNRIGFAINTSGNVIPQKAEAANNNAQSLGVSGNRWSKLYVGSADSYGSSSLPVYWNAGTPNVISSLKIEGQGDIQTTEGRITAGQADGTRECYVQARAASNRIMIDATTDRRGIWSDAGWVLYADTGGSIFTLHGNVDQIVFSTSQPSSPRSGLIWVKPL